jgi:Protein of unknown function (DUF1524)
VPARLLAALVLLAAVGLAACAPAPDGPPPGAGPEAVTVSGPAAEVLAQVAVRGRAPRTGYAREQFGKAWADTDRNGCGTRDDVLRRDLTEVRVRPGTHGCVADAGRLVDPYTGRVLAFRRSDPSAVQVDHVVALSDAWQKGAAAWTPARRLAFANDPLELLAVDGAVNTAKGDGDAATWLPPARAYRCRYVARQTAVKARYGLWMTRAEHDAVARVLTGCPGEPVPRA